MHEQFHIIAFVLFFTIAALYSSIGHAGASGYLAVMALLSFTPESIKPTSLILNIIVAAIASFKFISAGYFDRKIFFSLIIFSIPASFFGGYLSLSPIYFKLISGIFLIVAAFLLLVKKNIKADEIKEVKSLIMWSALLGSLIGFLSGIIGVGGGIFLTPLLLVLGWTKVKNASGISALFILFNSISGLMGHMSAVKNVDSKIGYWVIAVVIGGFIGSYLGSKRFNNKVILYCLFVILLTAGLKFIFIDTMK
ncbi:MAG: sulfite exporter TauE/SafE family protein [Sphingobacteriaceae bacterium]|nr:sulfite exporter TauE/SafE family protein [Sphingobacteriaceae bacterium]